MMNAGGRAMRLALRAAAVALVIATASVMYPGADEGRRPRGGAARRARLRRRRLQRPSPNGSSAASTPRSSSAASTKDTAAGPYMESPMTYEQLVRLAGNWNKEKKRDTSIKEVAVLDVLDQTAVAKVTAARGASTTCSWRSSRAVGRSCRSSGRATRRRLSHRRPPRGISGDGAGRFARARCRPE